MTEETSGWQPSDWAEVIKGSGQAASNILGSMSQSISTKREAKESKRRVLAKLMSSAVNRRLKLLRSGQEHENEIGDMKQKQLQDVARGFTQSFGGSTGRKK